MCRPMCGRRRGIVSPVMFRQYGGNVMRCRWDLIKTGGSGLVADRDLLAFLNMREESGVPDKWQILICRLLVWAFLLYVSLIAFSFSVVSEMRNARAGCYRIEPRGVSYRRNDVRRRRLFAWPVEYVGGVERGVWGDVPLYPSVGPVRVSRSLPPILFVRLARRNNYSTFASLPGVVGFIFPFGSIARLLSGRSFSPSVRFSGGGGGRLVRPGPLRLLWQKKTPLATAFRFCPWFVCPAKTKRREACVVLCRKV